MKAECVHKGATLPRLTISSDPDCPTISRLIVENHRAPIELALSHADLAMIRGFANAALPANTVDPVFYFCESCQHTTALVPGQIRTCVGCGERIETK